MPNTPRRSSRNAADAVDETRAFAFAALAISALTSVAYADDIPPCRPQSNAIVSVSLSRAPTALQAALAKDVGPMAAPGARFNATDVIDPRLPGRRLIFVWHHADLWIVATEAGGIAYSDPVLAYRLRGGTAMLVETRQAEPNTVCTTANALAARYGNKMFWLALMRTTIVIPGDIERVSARCEMLLQISIHTPSVITRPTPDLIRGRSG